MYKLIYKLILKQLIYKLSVNAALHYSFITKYFQKRTCSSIVKHCLARCWCGFPIGLKKLFSYSCIMNITQKLLKKYI